MISETQCLDPLLFIHKSAVLSEAFVGAPGIGWVCHTFLSVLQLLVVRGLVGSHTCKLGIISLTRCFTNASLHGKSMSLKVPGFSILKNVLQVTSGHILYLPCLLKTICQKMQVQVHLNLPPDDARQLVFREQPVHPQRNWYYYSFFLE